MATPPKQITFKLEDYPSLPKEMSTFFANLNLLSYQINQALTKQLTREDNFISQKKTLTISSASFPLTFQHNLLPIKPESVLIAQILYLSPLTPAYAHTLTWQLTGNNNITITSITGLVADKSYEITLIIT